MAGSQRRPGGPGGDRHPGWPAVLGPEPARGCSVVLRPLARRDFAPWRSLRLADRELIERWDATSELTWEQRHTKSEWRSHHALLTRAARAGSCLPFVVEVDGTFAGQVTIGGVTRGAVQSAWIGYWVGSGMTGRGVATVAVAMGIAHALGPVGLHRIEATIDPANAASRAVAAHIGLREEGLLRRYLDIHGAWRDHLLCAITVEEMPSGADPVGAMLARYRRAGGGQG